jgi:DNA invertase Pin-like site-specific DNA recombinase
MTPHTGFVAYYRVSTDKQGRSGLGLEAQQEAVRTYLNGGKWKIVGEFTEVETGKRSDRPKLAEALKACRKRKATLVIAKLDRLARNVHFISGQMDQNVPFVACDSPNDDRFMIHLKASFAEEEARKISIRTKAALQAAKARGTKLGGYRGASAPDAEARGKPRNTQ